MARPKKTGIDYFPMDTDMFEDDKIRLIKAEFGASGIVVYILLLCKIYRNGWFYLWGGDECLLLTEQLGAGFVPSKVEEVVKGLVRRSLFDKGVFDSFHALTSAGIQKRYVTVARQMGRTYTDCITDPEMWILPDAGDLEKSRSELGKISDKNDNSGIKRDNSEIKRDNSEIKYTKEKKLKETKQKEKTPPPEKDALSSCACENIPGHDGGGDGGSLIFVDDFIESVKGDNDFLEHVATMTQCRPENVAATFGKYSAQCKLSGDDYDTLKDHKRHFRNFVAMQMKIGNADGNGPTVTVHRHPLSRYEYIDCRGRRVCRDTGEVIPDDAPPRPADGMTYGDRTGKWNVIQY